MSNKALLREAHSPAGGNLYLTDWNSLFSNCWFAERFVGDADAHAHCLVGLSHTHPMQNQSVERTRGKLFIECLELKSLL